MNATVRYVASAIENIVLTYVTTVIGLLLAPASVISISTVHAASVAAIPAALAAVYSLLTGLKNGTASIVPTEPVAPAPVPVAVSEPVPKVVAQDSPVATPPAA